MLPAKITSPDDLEQRVLDWGFLPFFKNDIPHFSIWELTPEQFWFSDEVGVEGPWEWKGAVASAGSCVYGKFFHGRAGFIRLDWFAELCNARRQGRNFDQRYADPTKGIKERLVYQCVRQNESLLSTEIRELCQFGPHGQGGLDSVLTRLQMQTYLNALTFEYKTDRRGRPYGWGITRYTTPEEQFGAELVHSRDGTDPQCSQEKILSHLIGLWGAEHADALRRLLH